MPVQFHVCECFQPGVRPGIGRRVPVWLARLALAASLAGQSAACAGGAPALTAIPPQSLPAGPGQVVVVVANTGQVVIGASATGEVAISGHRAASPAGDFSLSTGPDEIRVEASYGTGSGGAQTPPVTELQVRVPAGVPVRVETFDAAVRLEGYAGQVRVDSAAGTIVADGLAGSAVLRSGRGDVTLTGSTGEFVVVGEHGVLSLSGVAGRVSASTIMGTIRWAGPASAEDQVRLETDHGPVEATISPAADLVVEASTTSGEVTCLIPGAPRLPRACQGALGAATARLSIRTVSGAVIVQTAP